MTTRKIIKTAVIGGGAFGEEHLRTFASMPQIEIGGVYTLDQTRGAELAQHYGGRNYASLEELANDSSLDLVSIVTPEHSHLEPFEVLSQTGKAIYVEKPLATSLDEAREMLELSQSLIAMSGHCLRFEARLASIFARLDGVPIYHFSSRNRRTRIEKETYGRVHPAYALLCHEIELSNAFAKSTFARVMALETQYSAGQIDGMNILIEYENGMTSSVEGGWYLPAQSNCVENDFVTVVSAKGIDEVSIPHLGHYHLDENGLRTPNVHYGYSVYGQEYGPLRTAFDYMTHCIQENKKPQISTIEDAYNAVEVIAAALQSAAEKRWVSRGEIVL